MKPDLQLKALHNSDEMLSRRLKKLKLSPSQTGDITQIINMNDNRIINVAAPIYGGDVVNMYYVNSRNAIVFCVGGTLIADTNVSFAIPMPFNLIVGEVALKVKTAPTGSSLIVDVNQNGTTIFTTQGNRPTIADGDTSVVSVAPDVTSLVKEDVLTIDIDQAGSTVAGEDLVVEVRGQP